MRHVFIINPTAGKGRDQRALAEEIGALDLDTQVIHTTHAGHARALAEEAGRSGVPTRLYACGGDGTLNEVVNGAAGWPNLAVTNVPLGTGNDFLKIFGPDCRKGFSDLEALSRGPQADFDLIECNGRLSIDIVCAGVDARIAADVHHYKKLPLVTGKGAYILSLVVNVVCKGIARPMEVKIGDFSWSGETSLLCVCNGRYYGGGFMPVGEAMPDDGVLETLLIPKVSLFTLARLVGKYAKGRYRDYPDLIWSFRGEEISLSADQPITLVMDGEVLRDTRVTIRRSDKKLAFFYPDYLDYRPKPAP